MTRLEDAAQRWESFSGNITDLPLKGFLDSVFAALLLESQGRSLHARLMLHDIHTLYIAPLAQITRVYRESSPAQQSPTPQPPSTNGLTLGALKKYSDVLKLLRAYLKQQDAYTLLKRLQDKSDRKTISVVAAPHIVHRMSTNAHAREKDGLAPELNQILDDNNIEVHQERVKDASGGKIKPVLETFMQLVGVPDFDDNHEDRAQDELARHSAPGQFFYLTPEDEQSPFSLDPAVAKARAQGAAAAAGAPARAGGPALGSQTQCIGNIAGVESRIRAILNGLPVASQT